MRAKELPRIDSIFRKKKDGNYTPDALLYQYILKYSVVLKIQNENRPIMMITHLRYGN
jgi:hypothetical protein